MTNSWQKAYLGLKDFVSQYSEIEIGVNKVHLPPDVRPEFYRLFDVVRTGFIEEKFSNLLNEATTLSQNYIKVEHEVTSIHGF